jgi:NTE family protein
LLPQGRSNPQFLDDLTDALVPSGGWLHHRATWLVGVDAQSGQRVAFGSPTAPPVEARDALRASWAIPGWYPPVMIGGRSYLDGGIASPTSADLLADEGLDEIVIVSPMASTAHVPGLLGRAEAVIRESMRHTLEAEIAILEARGIRVTAVLPSRDELSVMGFNFMDPRRRLAALDAALTHLPSRLAAQREGATL